jgi:hypothetical protein
MIAVTPVARLHKRESMHDLLQYHADQIDEVCVLALYGVAASIDELSKCRTHAVRIVTIGVAVGAVE